MPISLSNDFSLQHAAAKILVVDDDPFVRQIVVRVLDSRGCAAMSVGTAREALDILVSGREVRVFILGLDLRWIDGPALAAMARGIQPRVRVLYTASSLNGRCRSDGVEDPVLIKPFGAHELCHAVAGLV